MALPTATTMAATAAMTVTAAAATPLLAEYMLQPLKIMVVWHRIVCASRRLITIRSELLDAQPLCRHFLPLSRYCYMHFSSTSLHKERASVLKYTFRQSFLLPAATQASNPAPRQTTQTKMTLKTRQPTKSFPTPATQRLQRARLAKTRTTLIHHPRTAIQPIRKRIPDLRQIANRQVILRKHHRPIRELPAPIQQTAEAQRPTLTALLQKRQTET